MKQMQGIIFILVLLVLQGCSTKPVYKCGTFDLKQLNTDLKTEYFDRAGIEMAKATLVSLKLQLECERQL